MAVTVKIPETAHAALAELARDRKQPMGAVMADLVSQEERRAFLEQINEDFARLKADPAAWQDYWDEHLSMEGTLMDGLEEYPWEEE